MTDAVRHLLWVMQSLLDEHRKLVSESELQNRALMDGDTQALETIVQRMGLRVSTILNLEKRRQDIVAELAKQFSVSVDQVTVSFLSLNLSSSERNQLRNLSLKLSDSLATLKRNNERNDILTQQSLQYVRKTVEIVAATVYEGGYRSAKPAGSFLLSVQA